MPRPPVCRRIAKHPEATYFKPRGIPLSELDEVVLGVDELEAMRLADKEGLYQDDAGERMQISRASFGRIVEAARRKVTEALVEGKALRIEGGNFVMAGMRTFRCSDCRHTWQVPFGTGRPGQCPACNGRDFCRADKGRRGQVARHGVRCRRGGTHGPEARGSENRPAR
jgi:predicted DNA-binding protein (UPF0251 family)